MSIFDTELNNIRKLVKKPGYIYALIMLILEDFYIDLLKLHETNPHDHLGMREIALVLGFFVQEQIDYKPPKDFQELLEMKKSTRELMNKLHHVNSFI